MNRRQLLKTLSALPFVSFFLPAKAAGPKVERWAYQMFEYGAQMGVAATVHFHDPKLGLRQKRAAAR